MKTVLYNDFESDQALLDKDIILKSHPKGIQTKFLRLIKDILTNPRNKNTIGKPEQLKHTDIEKWSRELTKKDRIVYAIVPGSNYGLEVPEVVVFIQYLGHYDDK